MDNENKIGELRQKLREFVSERNWHEWQDAKNLSMSIAIEAAELMEIFQWIRTNELDDFISEQENMERVKEELADVVIYCLSMANVLDIDVSDAVLKKIEKNAKKYPADEYTSKRNNKTDVVK